MVNRAEPEEVHEHSDPVCPVCLNPIEAKQAVTIDHGEVVQRAVLGQASGEAPRTDPALAMEDLRSKKSCASLDAPEGLHRGAVWEARAPFGASSLINGVVSAIVGGTERVACSTTEHATRSTTGLGDFALPFPAFDLTLSLFAGVAIALLELAHQDLAVALDLIDFILGELAPLLPHLPLELSPLAFQRVTVHVTSIRRGKPMPCRTCP